MSQLALSILFEYLCYGSTTFIIFFNSFSVVIVFRRQILTTKADHRAARIKSPSV